MLDAFTDVFKGAVLFSKTFYTLEGSFLLSSKSDFVIGEINSFLFEDLNCTLSSISICFSLLYKSGLVKSRGFT
jgi:hypothetical protein